MSQDCLEHVELAGRDIKSWTETLGVLSSVAAIHLQGLAIACFENGVLMASLWNLYTGVMDGRHTAMQRAHSDMSIEVAAARLQSKLLEPMLEMHAASKSRLADLETENATMRGELKLARQERDDQFRCLPFVAVSSTQPSQQRPYCIP